MNWFTGPFGVRMRVRMPPPPLPSPLGKRRKKGGKGQTDRLTDKKKQLTREK